MQLPFYSEFRLPRYTHLYVCVCVCNRDTHLIYPSVSTRFSQSRICNRLSNLRRLVFFWKLFLLSLPFSLGCYSILLSSPSLSLLSNPISLSSMILLPGDASKVTGTRVSIARRRTYTYWTDLPLGHSSDTFTSVKRHAHMDIAQPFRRQITFVSRVSRR